MQENITINQYIINILQNVKYNLNLNKLLYNQTKIGS